MSESNTGAGVAKREWIEPEVAELPVPETAGFPGVGTDGGTHADCTLS